MSLAAHDLDAGADCPCDPDVWGICPVCEPDPPEREDFPTREEAIRQLKRYADPDCWRCGGDGVVDEETVAPDEPIFVAHRAFDG